ncbi:hypothetical protein [Neorhizobium sp. AL 9.2.2]|uniref:hypothetical protein n=1 Tax=Neorhizobium sp. AL 9.2.2 TaxID=2712894 RepID=UPI001574954A|nr:hypothetical protein [Neorhizobium sp. AL 9.2.2]NSY17266.1 hypothetical protein [Neorhizobium sp. AL 9.2.2]
MSGLELLAAGASAIGTGISAIGQIQSGKQQDAMAQYQADQMEQQAKDKMAVASRDAEQEGKKKDALLSRQVALAANSGGGVQNQSVLKILEDTEAAGQYNVSTAIYNGQQEAAGLRSQAEATRMEGRAASSGAALGAAGTLISGIGGAAKSYNSYKTKYGYT